ncbi:MAG: hypothetical protein JRI56_11600 [Deltaproteobacteria bacterium]|nr:hypothetical protein [Deltaproteobacteria bacterium]
MKMNNKTYKAEITIASEYGKKYLFWECSGCPSYCGGARPIQEGENQEKAIREAKHRIITCPRWRHRTQKIKITRPTPHTQHTQEKHTVQMTLEQIEQIIG